MPNIPKVTLNNGLKMPLEGFGVFQIAKVQCKKAVLEALSMGYRLIDTAQDYFNEDAVGSAIIDSHVPRSDIFLTTKVNPLYYNFEQNSYKRTQKSVLASLKKLQTNYLDLVLLHMPFGDVYSAYKALEDLYQKGILKSIGLSNFYADKYIDFINTVKIPPVINQVETHVFYQRKTLRKYLKKYDTQIEAWGPLTKGKSNLFTNSILTSIGKKYHKTAAQVALRFLVQNQIIIIPKSAHKHRMQENLDLWDFRLSNSEMSSISQLDRDQSLLDYKSPRMVEKNIKLHKKS